MKFFLPTRARAICTPREVARARTREKIFSPPAGPPASMPVCRELQRQVGDRPFFLSCRDAAAALALPGDEPHVTAWRWLNVLCERGFLVKGRVGTLAGRRATEFRYVGDK